MTVAPFWGHAGAVSAVAVTPDGRSVVSGGADDGTVRIWDRSTGRERLRLTTGASRVMALAVTPDGQQVVSGDDGGAVRIWDLDTGRQRASFTHWLEDPADGSAGHDDVTAVVVTPDGRRVVSAGWRGPIHVLDLDGGQPVATIDVANVLGLRSPPTERMSSSPRSSTPGCSEYTTSPPVIRSLNMPSGYRPGWR
ncbi:WD40 repeat domain-containing protein [Parafrankia irregularis]|uniref:WD40 repeat domain-containing protein n=1 Tax=Parafrankia irregularis TaxID=795642 RepID=UPI001042312C|nr:hypothetical protein [Parafrankia irregularis]MBE3203276.1 hypothetical protein [Parafrankia sp. CH37]